MFNTTLRSAVATKSRMEPHGWLSNPAVRYIALACATITVLALPGCGSQAAKTSSLRIWYSTDDPFESRWVTKLVHLFDQTHKNIHATIDVSGFDDFNTQMLAALGAGTPPDLAYATPRTCGIPKYVQDGELADLTSDAARLGWANRLRPGMLQDYNSPFTIFATKKYGVQPRNVKVFGVPYAMAAVAMMYNTKLLNRLHLSIPRSTSQLATDVTVAKNAGYTPLGLGNADGFLGDDWYQTLVNTRLGYAGLERELRIDPNFSFQGFPFEWASAQLYAWSADFTPRNGSLDAQDGVDQFFQGKTLFQLISSSENSQITSLISQTHIHVGVFGFPGSAAGSQTVMPQSGYEGWVVPTKGHNTAGAITFINWALQPSVQQFLLRQGVLPATPVAQSSSAKVSPFVRQYLTVLAGSRPGVFLDAAPILNLNATMEKNVQILLFRPQQLAEQPATLPLVLQSIYASHGKTNNPPPQIDCEF